MSLRILAFASTAGWLVLSPAVYALQATYALSYQGEYSSNVRQSGTSSNTKGAPDYLSTFHGQVGLVQPGGRFPYDVTAGMDMRHYANGSYKSDAVLTLDAVSSLKISPRRFEWSFEDYLGESQINSQSTNTPDNRQISNTFVTGPSLNLRLGKVDDFSISAKFSDEYQEVTNNDAQRTSASADWNHRFSLVSTMSVGYTQSEVKYQDTVANENSVRQRAFVNFTTQQARSTFSVDLGQDSAERARRGNTSNEMARLGWGYQVSEGTNFSISAAKELTDSGLQRLAVSQGTATAIQTSQNATSGIFESQRVDFSYSQSVRADQLTFRLFGEQQDYLRDEVPVLVGATSLNNTSGSDLETYGLEASWGRTLSPVLDASLSGNYSLTNYPNILLSDVNHVIREDTVQGVALAMKYQWAKQLSLSGGLSRTERDSTQLGQDYKDTRIMISITYGR